jgi:hypothetical protein
MQLTDCFEEVGFLQKNHGMMDATSPRGLNVVRLQAGDYTESRKVLLTR